MSIQAISEKGNENVILRVTLKLPAQFKSSLVWKQSRPKLMRVLPTPHLMMRPPLAGERASCVKVSGSGIFAPIQPLPFRPFK